jgi:iron-sulfur cluster assembly accessory protein
LEEDAIDEEEDHVFERDGARVVCDDVSYEFLKGSTVDFEEEMIRSSFAVVNNPNMESGCGCGVSFAPKM